MGGHRAVRGKTDGCLIPPGFAHGFLVLSDFAECLYKTTTYWAPMHERSIVWNDPDLAINWPLAGEPVLTAKMRRVRASRWPRCMGEANSAYWQRRQIGWELQRTLPTVGESDCA